MNHHIGHSPEIPFDLILNGIREVMGPVDMHLRIDQDMEIHMDIIRPAPAANLMELFYPLDVERTTLSISSSEWLRHR